MDAWNYLHTKCILWLLFGEGEGTDCRYNSYPKNRLSYLESISTQYTGILTRLLVLNCIWSNIGLGHQPYNLCMLCIWSTLVISRQYSQKNHCVNLYTIYLVCFVRCDFNEIRTLIVSIPDLSHFLNQFTLKFYSEIKKKKSKPQ